MGVMRRCLNCGRVFSVCGKVENHLYCGRSMCQRARRRKWQKKKRETDEAYRENQADCQKRWQRKNPDYWREYRRKNEAYTEKNREQQRERNRKNRGRRHQDVIAKMDALSPETSFVPGTYEMIPVTDKRFAKMDAIFFEIRRVSTGYG